MSGKARRSSRSSRGSRNSRSGGNVEDDFPEQELNRFRNQFRLFDIDGDGTITTDEVVEVMANLGERVSPSQAKNLIAEFDKDKNGKIDFSEFLHMIKKIRSGEAKSSGFAAVYNQNVNRFQGYGQSTHSFSENERAALVDFINSALKDDKSLRDVIPIDKDSMQVFEVVKDGVVLAKLINANFPNTISEASLVLKTKNKFEMNNNNERVIAGAAKIGVRIVNLGAADISDGKVHLVLGLIWQIVKASLLTQVVHNPAINRLKAAGEDFLSMDQLPPEQVLLRWINYHLKKAKVQRAVSNFTKDLADSEALVHLMHQLAPDTVDLSPLKEKDMRKRAEGMLRQAAKLNCRKFITADDIVKGNQRLTLAFVANLFNSNPGLGPSDEELRKKTEAEIAKATAAMKGKADEVIKENIALKKQVKELTSDMEALKIRFTREAGWTTLHEAVATGNVERVKEALKASGVDINARDAKGYTPLHEAAASGNVALVKALLTAGANVNAADDLGFTPLQNAVIQGDPKVIQALLDAKANLRQANNDGATAVHLAASKGQVAALMVLEKAGAKLDAPDLGKQTPLHYAARRGQKSAVDFLLSKGMSVSKPDQTGETALHHAVVGGNPDVIKAVIAKGGDVNQASAVGSTPLHLLARNGTPAQAQILLAKGAKPDAKDVRGWTPLHEAAHAGNVEMIKLLLSKGAPVDVQDKLENTPLHLAAASGNIEAMQELLKAKADVSAQNESLQHAVHLAAQNGHVEAVKLLLSKGADAGHNDVTGYTPLHYAVANGDEETAAVLLKANKGAIGSKTTFSNMPLHLAARTGHHRVVQQLLDRGADVDAQNASGATPLHEACAGGHVTVAEVLLRKGADVNKTTVNGATPLDFALHNGNPEVVFLLQQKGAKTGTREWGLLQEATKKHDWDFAKKLEDYERRLAEAVELKENMLQQMQELQAELEAVTKERDELKKQLGDRAALEKRIKELQSGMASMARDKEGMLRRQREDFDTVLAKMNKHMTSGVEKEGFLYVHSGGKIGVKTWRKYWFAIKGEYISWWKDKARSSAPEHFIYVEDTRTLLADEKEYKRKNTFQIITPDDTFVLSADRQNDVNDWIRIMRKLKNQLKNARYS